MLDNNPCQQDYILYIEGTEYGGIIDSIAPDPDNNKLAYKGRTWHGVLNSKVLEPDAGYDYLTVYGDANEVVLELIERMNLTDTFLLVVICLALKLEIINFAMKMDMMEYGKCFNRIMQNCV